MARSIEHETLNAYQLSSSRNRSLSTFFAWLGSATVYRLALDYTYVFWLAGSGVYGDGFDYGFDWLRQFESVAALFLLSALVPKHSKRTSDFLTLILFALCAVPITSYYAWAGGARIWFWALVAQFYIFRGVVLYFSHISFPRGLPHLICSQCSILIASLLLGSILYKIVETRALDLFSFSLEGIYERRELAAKKLEQGFWAYILSWGNKVCAIYLIIVGLERRNFAFVLFGVACAVLLFGIMAHKAIIGSAIVAVAVYSLFPFAAKRHALVLLGLGVMLALLALVGSYFHAFLYQDILARRLFFTTAKLDFLYYEFFKDQAPLYFSNSFLKSFIEYPFDSQYTLVMGEFAGMGGEGTAANNGFLATGFMQLGWIGVVLYPAVVGVLAATVDALANRRNPAVVGALCFYPFAALFTSSDLPTAFLTHGLGLLLLLFWLDSTQNDRNERCRNEH